MIPEYVYNITIFFLYRSNSHVNKKDNRRYHIKIEINGCLIFKFFAWKQIETSAVINDADKHTSAICKIKILSFVEKYEFRVDLVLKIVNKISVLTIQDGRKREINGASAQLY
jgi:hypothetical protein